MEQLQIGPMKLFSIKKFKFSFFQRGDKVVPVLFYQLLSENRKSRLFRQGKEFEGVK